MAYVVDTWVFDGSIEKEYKWRGKYGAKGEKRAPKRKATPEQIRKQNQQNREKYVRRLIKQNFHPDDLWVTLTYPKGTRKPVEEFEKDFRRFREELRKEYKKQGEPLKYIYRMEVGKRGGIHIHILVNRIRGKPDTDVMIKRAWKPGRAHYESIFEQGGYRDLAAYIVKEPDRAAEGQLTLFPEEDRRKFRQYSCSRNMDKPRRIRKKYGHWTMRRLLLEGPQPDKGYWIDSCTVIQGTNPYTGMSYLQFTEYRIDHGRGSPGKERHGPGA